MSAEAILKQAQAAGIQLYLDGGKVKGRGEPGAIEKLIEPLRQHKAEIVAVLEAQELTADLLRAAMLRCDEFGDSPAARQAMRQDVLDTPAHLQADLLQYFNEIKGSKPC